MSQNVQQRGARRGPAATAGRVITRDKHVPAKVTVGSPHEIDFRPATGALKGAVTVIISDGKSSRTFLMHHPIGITDLGRDEWVTSPVEEIPLLVARAGDPDAQRTQQLRAVYREKLACLEKPGILVDKAGIFQYPSGVIRSDAVKEARKLASTYDSAHKPPEGASVRPEGKAGAFYLEFLSPESVKREEMKYLEFCKRDSTVQAVEGKYPDDYRTMGGVNADNPQSRASMEGREPPSSQLFDGLVYQIANMTLLTLSDAKALKELGALPEIPRVAPKIPPRPKTGMGGIPPASASEGGKGGSG